MFTLTRIRWLWQSDRAVTRLWGTLSPASHPSVVAALQQWPLWCNLSGATPHTPILPLRCLTYQWAKAYCFRELPLSCSRQSNPSWCHLDHERWIYERDGISLCAFDRATVLCFFHSTIKSALPASSPFHWLFYLFAFVMEKPGAAQIVLPAWSKAHKGTFFLSFVSHLGVIICIIDFYQ